MLKMPDICIVSMPYNRVHMPSIGIGQLVSAGKERGIDTKALYANIWFAEKIGLVNYNIICHLFNPASLLAEWTFSKAAFPDFCADDDEYISMAVSSYHDEDFINDILNIHSGFQKAAEFLFQMRKEAGDFIIEVAERILDMKPRVVGCSSTFQQHCSSLALLRALKEMDPKIITLMGGANCEAVMGQTTLGNFPWLDFVMSGECDLIFPDFCEKVLAGGTGVKQAEMPYGVITREYVKTVRDNDMTSPVAWVENMESVPVPDYTDYFEEFDRFGYKEQVKPSLVIETSRGCWWGQKNKCKFCGLNGKTVKFRVKSSDRVIDEINTLSKKYSIHRFFTSDNIMDMNHFKELIPRISQTQIEVQKTSGNEPDQAKPEFPNRPVKKMFFFETKSNLNEEQVIALKNAGINWIQPGIESLNDQSLKLINKGNSAIGNVALLKYAMENGIKISWNYLIGIPGEKDDWNTEVAQWLHLIYHLEPPDSIGNIRFDRFSEYYKHPEEYGLKLSPYKTYSYIYPIDNREIENIASFFEDYSNEGRGKGPGVQLLNECIREWSEHYFAGGDSNQSSGLSAAKINSKKPQLIIGEGEDFTLITDTRTCALNKEYCLEGLEHKVYKFCRQPRQTVRMLDDFNRHYGLEINRREMDKILGRLDEWKLVLTLGGKVLSLATRETAFNKNRAGKPIPSFEWLK